MRKVLTAAIATSLALAAAVPASAVTSWTNLLPGDSVLAVATSPGPAGGSVVFAGCNASSVYGAGVLRSDDGGATWANVLPGVFTNDLDGDPFSAGTVYAATNSGLFKTADWGATWSQPLAAPVSTVAASPASPGVVFADAYLSPDGGETWTGTGAPPYWSVSDTELNQIKPTADASVVYYVAAEEAYVSLDGGMTYLSLHPADTVEPLAGAPLTFYSGQCGGSLKCTYQPSTNGLSCMSLPIGGHTHAFALHPANENKVLSASRSSGTVVTFDGGVNWSGIPGSPSVEFYPAGRMVIDPVTGVAFLPGGGLWAVDADCFDFDGDGAFVECEPLDCNEGDPAISPLADENCSDCIDNNCDGLVDRFDPLAIGCPACYDDDCDGYSPVGGGCGKVDCDDNDRYVNPWVNETCFNGIDDDCDGLSDCDDTKECSAYPSCVVLEICDDGLDNDGDRKVDCADRDCQYEPACQPVSEICDDGIDNDGDRKVDCADRDCRGSEACL